MIDHKTIYKHNKDTPKAFCFFSYSRL